jgi:hypothetical protein
MIQGNYGFGDYDTQVGDFYYPYSNSPTVVVPWYQYTTRGGCNMNSIKLGTILTEANTLYDINKGELVLLVPGYKPSDFELFKTDDKKLVIKVSKKKLGGKKIQPATISFDVNPSFDWDIVKFTVAYGVLRIKIGYKLGTPIPITRAQA